MARQLEPLLWRRFTHVQVAAGLESENIDLDLAANEGIQILGLDFLVETNYTVATSDFTAAVIARPSAEDSISTIAEAFEDSDFVAGFAVNIAVLTSGAIHPDHQHIWRPPTDGLTIARRMTYLQDVSLANARMTLTVWYKRLIFTNDEMLGLIIRRR